MEITSEINICANKPQINTTKIMLLKDIKQADLSPRAAKLYNISKKLIRKHRYLKKQNVEVRRRLKNIERTYSNDFIEKYNGFSKTQRMFIKLQLRTAKQAPKVSKSVFINTNYMNSKAYSLTALHNFIYAMSQ